ncbi:MAG: hypothetical protein NUV67_02550 [archaeon]|nr:hypothetical protein [archaeon]
MALIRKMLFFAILLGVLYIVATNMGFLGEGAQKLRALDKQFSVGEEKFVPATITELEQYKNALGEIDAKSEAEKSMVELKLGLVEMQKSMLSMKGHLENINYDEIDCRVAGPIVSARQNAEQALVHAKGALAKKSSVAGLEGFSYITASSFDETMNAVISSLERQVNSLKTLC